jgi:MFS superfamily sulfate permease-like transporter
MNNFSTTIEKLKRDIPASIVVFLVALPLCLGVSLASGAPILSGLISGIIGGIVVGTLSGSQTSVSGPAAGLTSVVFTSIISLGSFEDFLFSVLIAGVLQILMGLVRAGNIADYIPSNVIKGLLAAIGIILIIKQIPHAIGYDDDPEDDFSFIQTDGQNTFSSLLVALNYFKPGAVIISLFSLFTLIYWDKSSFNIKKFFPSSLFVVLIGSILNYIFINYIPFLEIESSHLVNIPSFETNNLSTYLYIPDFINIYNPKIWITGITIAGVASLETLLNIEAIDKLDPHKRQTPPNRELISQGIGNICVALFGGIPVTSVIVRSSVNIQSGNETKYSSIIHGFLILLSILFFSSFLNFIPLSCLAAILIMTGYKLTKFSLFKEMYYKDWDQFIPFTMTVISIIFTDLLYGVLIGLAFSIFFILKENYTNPFTKEEFQLHIGDVIRIELSSHVTFLNRATIKNTLWGIPNNSKVVLDASNTSYIDNDIMEIIQDFKEVRSEECGIKLNIIGLRNSYSLTEHVEFINFLDKKTQEKLTPIDILEILKNGNERFVKGNLSDKFHHHQLNALSTEQNPMAIILSCIDSRTSPEILFDANLGDLLTVRIAGNIVNKEIIESIDFAYHKFGIKLIIVKGHSHCGAIQYSIDNRFSVGKGNIVDKIKKSVFECGCEEIHIKNKDPIMLENITRMNTKNSIQEIIEGSLTLSTALKNKEIGIIEAYHEISSGKVFFGEI